MNLVSNPYLIFRQVPTPGKTQVWHVLSKRSGDLLGTIKWYGAWRQYTFFPSPDTIFNVECMASIMNVIAHLMNERKEARA